MGRCGGDLRVETEIGRRDRVIETFLPVVKVRKEIGEIDPMYTRIGLAGERNLD